MRSIEAADPGGIEFMLKHVEQVPYSDLIALTQTRRQMRADGYDELERAIEALDIQGRPRNELFHPIMLNSLDAEHARAYVDDLNLCHGTSHQFDELVPAADGRYKIIIAGHRRHEAIGKIITRQGGSPATSTVPCSMYENLSFQEALRKQIDENTHQQLSVTEVARAIHATYRYGVAKGQYTSLSDCVRDLPFGEEKVRHALRFCELPPVVQQWVDDGHLAYGAAVALYPLMSGLEQRYARLPEEERASIITEYILAYAIQIIDKRWGRDVVRTQIEELLRSRETLEQLTLFQQDEQKLARQYRHRVTKDLFFGGINRLRQFYTLDMYQDMPPEQLEAMAEELQRFVISLGSVATNQQPERLPLQTVS